MEDDAQQINDYLNKVKDYEKQHKQLADNFKAFALILFAKVFRNKGEYEVGSSYIVSTFAGRGFRVDFTSNINKINKKLNIGYVKCTSNEKVVAEFKFDELGNVRDASPGIVSDSINKELFALSFGYCAINNGLAGKAAR